MPTLLIPPSTILPPPNLIYSIGRSKRRERERERARERQHKTTFGSPKQEHLLIVEVTVSVQPHALNTTLLVLMMHRMEGRGGWRSTLTEKEREREQRE